MLTSGKVKFPTGQVIPSEFRRVRGKSFSCGGLIRCVEGIEQRLGVFFHGLLTLRSRGPAKVVELVYEGGSGKPEKGSRCGAPAIGELESRVD